MERNTCYLLLFLVLINFSWVQAQTRLGLKAGVVTSGVKARYNDFYQDYTHEAKAGALFGVMANCPISKNIIFRPGVELVIKGSRERHRGTDLFGEEYGFSIGQPLTCIDIPLNFLNSTNSGKGKFLIGGGPVASFLLNPNNSSSFALRSFDPGMNIQASYQWPIGFSLNLNHTRSLQNISSDKQYLNQFRNYYTGLTLGYIF